MLAEIIYQLHFQSKINSKRTNTEKVDGSRGCNIGTLAWPHVPMRTSVDFGLRIAEHWRRSQQQPLTRFTQLHGVRGRPSGDKDNW